MERLSEIFLGWPECGQTSAHRRNAAKELAALPPPEPEIDVPSDEAPVEHHGGVV